MAEIEDMGLEEYYAPFVKITGKRGSVLLFYDDEPPIELADEIGVVLDQEEGETSDAAR